MKQKKFTKDAGDDTGEGRIGQSQGASAGLHWVMCYHAWRGIWKTGASFVPVTDFLSSLAAVCIVTREILVLLSFLHLRRVSSQVLGTKYFLILLCILMIQKEYAAVVWLSRPVTQADFEALSSLKELVVFNHFQSCFWESVLAWNVC